MDSALSASQPIVPKREIVRRQRSGEQLKHRKNDPARVDLLEHGAYRFFRRVSGQVDDGELIPGKRFQDLVVESVEESRQVSARMSRFVVAPVEIVREYPIHAVEQTLGRHHVVFVLELRLGEVEYNPAPKIPGDFAVFRDAYYRVFSIDRGVHRLEHVNVVPAPYPSVAVVLGVYRPVVHHRLIQT